MPLTILNSFYDILTGQNSKLDVKAANGKLNVWAPKIVNAFYVILKWEATQKLDVKVPHGGLNVGPLEILRAIYDILRRKAIPKLDAQVANGGRNFGALRMMDNFYQKLDFWALEQTCISRLEVEWQNG